LTKLVDYVILNPTLNSVRMQIKEVQSMKQAYVKNGTNGGQSDHKVTLKFVPIE